jgi:malonyl-CoA O-methyltransferase
MRRRLFSLHRSPIPLDVIAAYEQWAPTYPACAHTPLMQIEEPAMLALLPEMAERSALDLACGSGRYLTKLIERGARRAVGLDLSSSMLARAQTISSHLVQANLCALPFAAASFDIIVSGLAVGHVENLPLALAEVARVLTPRGIVVYSDLHPLGALLGWKRTFHGQDGKEYEVHHMTHLYSDHHVACRAAGLVIEDVHEPRINFAHPQRGAPAVLVIRARKVE